MDNQKNFDSFTDQAVSFEQYFAKKIIPIVETDNHFKEKQKGRFWASLWIIVFLLSINALIALYFSLMHHKPINYNQLLILAIVGIGIIYWPIHKYYQYKRVNIFDVFIQFYGTWIHNQNSEQEAIKTDLFPQHDNVKFAHDISGEYCGVKLRLCDTVLLKNISIQNWRWQKNVAKGVLINFVFNHEVADNLYLLEKKGFFHKDLKDSLVNIGSRIHIPAANYFYVFNSTEIVPDRLLSASFFEQVLDIKGIFSASKIYIHIQKNKIQIFLAGAELYFENYKFWSGTIKQDKFKQLYTQFEYVFTFVETIFIVEKRRQKYETG